MDIPDLWLETPEEIYTLWDTNTYSWGTMQGYVQK